MSDETYFMFAYPYGWSESAIWVLLWIPYARISWLMVSASEWIVSANMLCEPVYSQAPNLNRHTTFPDLPNSPGSESTTFVLLPISRRHSFSRFSREPHTAIACASTSFRQYTVIGGSCSYGDLRFVFGSDSRSDGFSRKSDIARTGVMKLRSKEDREKSTRMRFLASWRFFSASCSFNSASTFRSFSSSYNPSNCAHDINLYQNADFEDNYTSPNFLQELKLTSTFRCTHFRMNS
ncbi:phosphatidylinositol glycan, class c [Culex quinquefasciatus]|uniref:Phosphatidylinositol glycan, class c n=1 Tax=Culex quinquefasciatus TaxID=7176 RepID=B0WV90_CULQU|nr:phosphatidylinositol glycan, class c [Culex quinquefasciatus]|eukprot:XP_001861312.1 phosphatidylinositol glycan, class c [Culex quinquefasciatus]